MRILVTGITGFAGGHLAEALLDAGGASVVGTARRAEWPTDTRHLAGRVRLLPCDLCDRASLLAVLRDVQPEQVYHLAGYAHTGLSFREPDVAWAGNLTATRFLYDAIEAWGGRPRVLAVGSGLIYGDPERPDQPHDEQSPLRPASPYASSKAAADLVSYQVTRAPGLDVVRVRPFNHIGPRQSPEFATAHFARQIAAIEQGLQPPLLETGDLSPRRDLTDVRDMVRAYMLLMERGRKGEAYNVGSGEAVTIRLVLDQLLALARLPVEVRQRAELVRPSETSVMRADTGKLRREIGWTPGYTLAQTLADILEYWRHKERDEGLRDEG
jgi:GDP-4-dehydro-6-deoxy-D-mannose reductase